MAELVEGHVAAVAENNHVRLWAVTALADFADAGVVDAAVRTAAAGGLFCGGVKVGGAVDLATGFCFDAFHGEFLRGGILGGLASFIVVGLKKGISHHFHLLWVCYSFSAFVLFARHRL